MKMPWNKVGRRIVGHAGLALAIGTASVPCLGIAADTDWTNAGVGDFFTAANWSAGLPDFAVVAGVNNGGTVQYNDTSGPWDIGGLVLGENPGQSGKFEFSQGDLLSSFIRIGERGTGEATVSGGTLAAGGQSLFVGGQDNNGTGVLNLNGGFVTSGDDVQLGRIGTGTLNFAGGVLTGGYTVVGKFGTGIWNQSGGAFRHDFGDFEIGDGGTPAQASTPGPRYGEFNFTGGTIHVAERFAMGNRSGGSTVNIDGGALAITGDPTDRTGDARSNILYVGRCANWAGNNGAGGDHVLRITGDESLVIVGLDMLMNPDNVHKSATLVADITGPTHSPILIGRNANIANGSFAVELSGYAPVSGDTWTILQTGVDLTSAVAEFDARVAAQNLDGLYDYNDDGVVDANDTVTFTHNINDKSGSVLGTFKSFDTSNAPLANGLSWDLSYTANAVILSVIGETGFAADFNGDGKVDGADLTTWETAYGTGELDGSDLLVWQQQFGSGVGASVSAAGVPEPAAGLLALCAAACGAIRRRR